jgi:hypothetical protein
MLKTKSIATVGNRNRYGANREPHRDGLGGVTNDLPSAGDIAFGALIRNCFGPPNVGRARLPNGLKCAQRPLGFCQHVMRNTSATADLSDVATGSFWFGAHHFAESEPGPWRV